MRKTIFIGLLATSLAAPVAAYAQARAPAPAPTATPAPAQSTSAPIIIDPQWLGIAAGVVVGAVTFNILLETDLAFIAGGVIGGYVATLWFSGHDVRIVSSPKT